MLNTFLSLTPADCSEILDNVAGSSLNEGVQFESPENRVFGFGDVVVKFYRPGRWSIHALRDELQFLEDLRDANVPFVRPIGDIGTWRDIHYLVFEAVPKPYNVDPEILDEDAVRTMVHLVAQIHDVGAKRPAMARPQFEAYNMCYGCFEVICRAGFIPKSLHKRYTHAIEQIVSQIENFGHIPIQRIHGDSYSGNALWRADGPIFLDLDDFQMGPVAMDIPLLSFPWRLNSLPKSMDRRERRNIQHQLVLDLYREVRPFPKKFEALIPLIRGCRNIVFDAWFSTRWNEPGFRKHYEDDNITNPDWWQDSIEELERATK
ncbi:phosphotransferase [Candidatus Uabimicrobium sp. HlEnr_7]|uniref:phosphotransferase n=1 Tax=Candidatus Uabimicrobium helgolandensis TaxID=3095367 RepID=UPI0035576606